MGLYLCENLPQYFVLSRENVEISGKAQKSLITQIEKRLHRLESAKGLFSELLWIPKETN